MFPIWCMAQSKCKHSVHGCWQRQGNRQYLTSTAVSNMPRQSSAEENIIILSGNTESKGNDASRKLHLLIKYTYS